MQSSPVGGPLDLATHQLLTYCLLYPEPSPLIPKAHSEELLALLRSSGPVRIPDSFILEVLALSRLAGYGNAVECVMLRVPLVEHCPRKPPSTSG